MAQQNRPRTAIPLNAPSKLCAVFAQRDMTRGLKTMKVGELTRPLSMPKGPQGQKRPADVIGAAVLVGRIATGEAEDTKAGPKSAAAELGSKGGKARAANMSRKKRSEAPERRRNPAGSNRG